MPDKRIAWIELAAMKITPLSIPDVLLIEPAVFVDTRGEFMENYQQQRYEDAIGRPLQFVQDNISRSRHYVLRGLHYQLLRPQGKLVSVVEGVVFDVAVDLRRSSPTFGRWVGATLSAENHQQLWVPEGFAHGFLVLSDSACSLYKSTEYYAPSCERCVRWDDPALNIAWPLDAAPILSDKDRAGLLMDQAETFA